MDGIKYQRLGAIATKLRPRTSLLVFAVVAVACARGALSPYKEMRNKDHRLMWAAPRTEAELDAEKYTENDTVIEAEIVDQGYRYSFVPSDVISSIGEQSYNRFTLRVDMRVTVGGTTDNRVFINIDEIDKSDEGIPFAEFNFNSFAPWPLLNGHVDVPITANFMKIWLSKPNASITFNYDIEFGARSFVGRILAKPPVMIFTSKKRSRCEEYSCCLSNQIYDIDTKSKVYSHLVEPRGLELRRCVECTETHIQYTGNVDTFNLVIHRQIDSDLIPKPVERGRCRATGFASLKTKFWYSENETYHVPEIYMDHFFPTACKCVEDENIPENWYNLQVADDNRNRTAAMRATKDRKRAIGADSKAETLKLN